MGLIANSAGSANSATGTGINSPFLKSVPDFDDESPLFSWTKTFTTQEVEKALASSGHNLGMLLSVRAAQRAPSGRAQFVLATGSQGAQFLSAEELRRLFKLPSTNFNVGTSQGSYVFAGRGFGHGMGLSQWGSKALADKGFNAAQILNYYYKDVTLEYL
jgi:stage II sporulation protein D